MIAADLDDALEIERLVYDGPRPLPPDPFLGTRLGPWRTIDVIGRGGMGTVYLAERADGQYEQRVALKIVRESEWSGAAARMFGAERRILARLTHPEIARLLDAGFAPDGARNGIERMAGGDDPSAAYMGAQLARCVVRGGRLTEGSALLERALEVLRHGSGRVADYAANTRLWLGLTRLDAGDAGDAEPLVRAAADHYRRSRPAGHPVRAEAECGLAEVLAVRGQVDDALALAETCVAATAAYGQMEPWRKASAARLLERLRSIAGRPFLTVGTPVRKTPARSSRHP